jgi:hypothetical protein
MMQRDNGYWISGTAVPGPPYTTYWTPHGTVLRQRTNGSVVELVRFTLDSFELADDGVAEWFGLELAQIVVDECLSANRKTGCNHVARTFNSIIGRTKRLATQPLRQDFESFR